MGITDGPWLVQQICCGRDDGTTEHPTWEAADSWRDTYVDSATDGHERSGIVTGKEPADG